MRTVFWEDDTVRVIDQRPLPGQLEVLTPSTVGQVADAIGDMAARGDPAIGATAALARTVQPPRSEQTVDPTPGDSETRSHNQR